MNADLPRIRSLLGKSAAMWAGRDGVTVGERGWTALSGARSVDYNVVLCHGASRGADLDAGVNRLAAAGVPGMVIVAGDALGEVQRLIELGWVCVGSVPLMLLDLEDPGSTPAPLSGASPPPASAAAPGPAARRLDRDQLDAVRGIVAGAFGISPDLARVAIPPDVGDRTGQSVWGAFGDDDRLVSCLVAVRIEDVVVIWSMATAAGARGRGHGAAALRAALAGEARHGARNALLYSSAVGEPFYRAFGYQEVERWQLWSRPRWVLGRA